MKVGGSVFSKNWNNLLMSVFMVPVEFEGESRQSIFEVFFETQ